MQISDFQKTWGETVALSELDLAILARSRHLDGLREIKARGGKDQEWMRGAMLSIFDSTTLGGKKIMEDLRGAIERTLDGETKTKITSTKRGTVTTAKAVRELFIAEVFNKYVAENIGAISDRDDERTMDEHRQKTILANSMEKDRVSLANDEIIKLIGGLRQLEKDPDMSGTDPHIVLVIARKELEMLGLIKRVYEEAESTLDSMTMVQHIKDVTRPKLLALIEQMEGQVGHMEVPSAQGRTATEEGAKPKRKRRKRSSHTGHERTNKLRKLILAGLASLTAVGTAGLLYIAGRYMSERNRDTEDYTTSDNADKNEMPLTNDNLEDTKTGNFPEAAGDDDSAH